VAKRSYWRAATESVRLADQYQLKSLAFPAISTGAYGYPVHEAACIAISSTVEALELSTHVTLCRFVLFDVNTVRRFERAAEVLSEGNSLFRIEKVHS
jgi:O-acetyl-ADP-ribose deacetylase